MSKDIMDIFDELPDKIEKFIFDELPDKIEKHKHPLILTIVFLSIYFIIEIPEHWEIGFHMFYFVLMASFLGYIYFCLNVDEKPASAADAKKGEFLWYIEVLAFFSLLFFGLYFLFNTFMHMSGDNQNTFLKGTLYVGIGFIMFLLFRYRVPNDVSIKRYEEYKKDQLEAKAKAKEEAKKAKEGAVMGVIPGALGKDPHIFDSSSSSKSPKSTSKKRKIILPEQLGGSEVLPQKPDKGKSYFISIITEPFYIIKDAFDIIVCLFNDKESWDTVTTLLRNYISYHSPAFLLFGVSSFILYSWINYSPSSKSGVLIDTDAKSLDIEHVVAKSKDLYPKGNRDYSFSLCGRMFIEQPLDIVDKEYNLIDYGDVPRMTYNPKRHTIYVYMKKGRKEIRVHEIDEIEYQKWNHFVFNYSHGTMDIFWNTKLIASVHEIIPFMTMDSIVVGEHQGIRGGMKELRFRHEPLSMFNIYSSYYFM